VRQFLSLEKYGGWVLKLNSIIGIFWAYAFITPFLPGILPQRPLLMVGDLAGALSGAAGMVTTIHLWRRGNLSAKYFTIAWGLLIVSNMMFALMLEGMLDRNPFTVYSLQVGFVIEVVLLSLVLAERINRERAAREVAQIEALQMSQQFNDEREAKLAIQAEALAMQRAANEELELRVRERTKDLESAMQAVERFNRELKELSITDSLTGVFNRRYFEKTFADELSQAHRHQHPLSVVVLDLDHFKQINDVHGHLAGDECLKLVAGVLRQRLARPGDIVARYGGEEFVVLLPATSQEDATAVADQLRLSIEKLDFLAAGQRISLTASFGVAGWVPAQGERYERLIAAADTALYQAKNRGRNCTVAAAG
jgi:diguanylate cyclase